MTTPLTLPLAVALPMVGSVGVLLLRHRPNLREATSLVAGVAAAIAVVSLWPNVHEGLRLKLWSWFPGLALAFELEPVGLLFATVAAALWPVTTVFSIGYLRANGYRRQTSFYFFFALSMGAALWIAFSANLVTLFIGYELLTLATVPLVIHERGPEASRAGRVYLGLLLATSICLLL
ncbi:MAG: monovalent cation/H+ antiporter subunit D family protein, partial [Actinomycetota bacterium]|nr:monovalent cation/H+ antiporter subunit D family protein [Actinomycetota bacterium]